MKILQTAMGVTLLSLCFIFPANASLLTFYNDAASTDTTRFTLNCTLGCTAWDGTDFLGTDGDMFTFSPSSDQDEIDAVNLRTGESYTDITKDESENTVFSSSAEYLLIKVGTVPDYALIKNTSVGNVFTFTQIATGTGLSHVSEFGAVPVPAAVWLFGTALLGFIGMSRRTKV